MASRRSRVNALATWSIAFLLMFIVGRHLRGNWPGDEAELAPVLTLAHVEDPMVIGGEGQVRYHAIRSLGPVRVDGGCTCTHIQLSRKSTLVAEANGALASVDIEVGDMLHLTVAVDPRRVGHISGPLDLHHIQTGRLMRIRTPGWQTRSVRPIDLAPPTINSHTVVQWGETIDLVWNVHINSFADRWRQTLRVEGRDWPLEHVFLGDLHEGVVQVVTRLRCPTLWGRQTAEVGFSLGQNDCIGRFTCSVAPPWPMAPSTGLTDVGDVAVGQSSDTRLVISRRSRPGLPAVPPGMALDEANCRGRLKTSADEEGITLSATVEPSGAGPFCATFAATIDDHAVTWRVIGRGF